VRDHFEALAAAHALLEIVPSFSEAIFNYRQHRVIALGKKNVAGADEDLRLIGLGARLIEAFGQIVQIERNEVDDALAGDPQPLSFFHFERRAGILRHDASSQQRHRGQIPNSFLALSE
jgi:hypothetical protein